MRPLSKPTLSAPAVFRQCTDHVQNVDLRLRLRQSLPAVTAASAQFDMAAQTQRLHTIPLTANVGRVSTDEMVKVYDLRMAKKKSRGRPVYDQLLAAPAYGRCPLCGVGAASTLDHHLPKKDYPALAVAPFNLVPACRDCNTGKRTITPTTSEEETLHPYYDDVTTERWIEALVRQGPPVHLEFYVANPPGSDALTAARVRSHFAVFNLGKVYGANASEHLAEIRYAMTEIHHHAGASAVEKDLDSRARSSECHDLNSWKSAGYRALASDSWYCNGGFDNF